MKRKRNKWTCRVFILAFLVLTFFCWCPMFYGSYGPVDRIMGVPSWAVFAAIFGIALFILEWVYLFGSRLAMNDEELPKIITELSAVNAEEAAPGKEDK